MARSKEFDEERALAAAMDVFWRQGYENTSLEALMREMGIARQSLYDTFGDKRTLYLKAMAFYRERTNSSLRESLASASTVKEGFTRVLLGLVAESREQHARGCLLLSANMERAVDDEEIARFLEDNQAEVESIFAEVLRRAQRRGELRPGTDAGALAKFFVADDPGNAGHGATQVGPPRPASGCTDCARSVRSIRHGDTPVLTREADCFRRHK